VPHSLSSAGVLAATVHAAAARTCPTFSCATPPSAVAACCSTLLVLPVFIGTLLASVFANSIAFLGWCAVLSVYLCFCPSLSLSLSLSLSVCLMSCVLCLVSCVCVCVFVVCMRLSVSVSCVLYPVSCVLCLVSGSVAESFVVICVCICFCVCVCVYF